MHELRILLVEDEAAQRKLVAGILSAEGHQVHPVGSVDEALAVLEKRPIDLVVSDWRMPGRTGFDLLEEVRARYEETAFVMVTAYGTIDRAVQAVRMGADDFLTKPFVREALLLAIERAGKSRRLQHENRRLNEALDERRNLVDLVGRAPKMQQIFRRVEKLATTGATVLIQGESGTGKELTARAIHTLSHRVDKPFVAVNCAAVPEGLLESEFFGAERGAYTGADKNRVGKFEAADGGTLFLDEVGELPLSIQPKLLRALQENSFTRVGAVKETRVDIRIVVATNRDLAEEVAEGRFREDLYYRLNVVPISLPPLRERKEDIPILVKHFIQLHSRKHGIHVSKPPSRVLKYLCDYHWPGNARELANAVERLILLSDEGELSPEDLPAEVLGRGGARHGETRFTIPPGGMSWEAHERDCLLQAMEMAGGNRRRAARLLGLNYKAFLYRLEKAQKEDCPAGS
ncbi:MAG: sigma-54 dependent transcriptional regulator [Acidobacteriota bacterium]|nr:sigma-54 dependent transcriptional regulator [Acidobacteriota bacterium]